MEGSRYRLSGARLGIGYSRFVTPKSAYLSKQGLDGVIQVTIVGHYANCSSNSLFLRIYADRRYQEALRL